MGDTLFGPSDLQIDIKIEQLNILAHRLRNQPDWMRYEVLRWWAEEFISPTAIPAVLQILQTFDEYSPAWVSGSN